MTFSLWRSILIEAGLALAQAPADKTNMAMQGVESPRPDFQTYIFLAYGLACILLLGFTLWSASQVRKLEQRLDYLTERFQKAHPGQEGTG
ncbi:MAG TPA: hypothetical protein VMT52_12485 [Planctomycetota bacterium]|nr:hypothetical protein [Planctomycetota bacterium]